MPSIKVNRHPAFAPLYDPPPGVDTFICIGGRGGMKTYEVSKFCAVKATTAGKRVAVLRDEKEAIRESILNEIFLRYDTANAYGHFNSLYDKLETGIRDKASGNMVVFTKGFRASSNEKRSNLKGVSDTDIAVIEEMEDIRDFLKFSTFKDSIRTKDRMIIMILNTPDIQHWIIRRYFDLEPVTFADVPELFGKITEKELDGYWKLLPKQVSGFVCIQTNYTDNQHLPEGVLRDYRAYGDPASNTYDLHYYLTSIKGFASSGRKGQVLRKVKPIKLKDYLAIPAVEVHGIDFGTASPAGMVGVKFLRNALYARQLNYEPFDTLGLARKMCQLGITGTDMNIADSADPISIGRLRRGWKPSELSIEDAAMYPQLLKGFNVRGAIKGVGHVQATLGTLNSMDLYFVDDYPINQKTGMTDLWHEVWNYIYAQNKEGEFTNEPIDGFNHLIDPIRYVAQARGRFF